MCASCGELPSKTSTMHRMLNLQAESSDRSRGLFHRGATDRSLGQHDRALGRHKLFLTGRTKAGGGGAFITRSEAVTIAR